MRRPSLWLAIGIATGAAINDSVVALFAGVGIAVAPYVGLVALDLGGWVARRSWGPRRMWREIEEFRLPAAVTSPRPGTGGLPPVGTSKIGE